MKIILEAQYTCSAEPRGISHYTIQVIRQLLKRHRYSYELTFFDGNREMGNYSRIEKHFSSFNVPTHECNTISYRETFSNREIYKDKSYNDYTGAYGDIFHFFNLVSIPGNLKGEMVVTIHDMLHVKHPEYYSPRAVEMIKFNLCYLEKMNPIIITPSKSAKEDVLHLTNTPESKIYVVPESFDEQSCLYPNDTGLLSSLGIYKPYLLFLSANAGNKNLCRIIDAFESLAERFSDILLVIAGGTAILPDYQALSKISESRFSDRIITTGYVTDEQKHVLYSNALVFLFPSLFEGFGLPILEAMARGCPVITSNVSSMPEVAGDAAILIDPYNTEQLAHEIERVISSNTLRDEMKRKGLEQCKKFSWDKTAAMTEDVYGVAANCF